MVEVAAQPPELSVDRLVRAVLSRDCQATELFCRHYQPVLRHCLQSLWQGVPLLGAVEDAVQEAIFECLRPGGALAHFDPRRGHELDSYLRGVARNVAARIEQREARYAARWQTGLVLEENCAVEGDLPDQLGRASLSEAVRRAVDVLDRESAVPGHTYGELIRLHFREGLAVREIATRWQLPPEQVHELRRGACQRLRRLLARVGLAHMSSGN